MSKPLQYDQEQPKQKFTGYWIPVELSHLGLTRNEQFLLSMLDSLEAPAPDYCFASNKYLAEHMQLSESRVSFYLTKFKRMGLIKEIGFDGRRRRLACLKENWYKRNFENELNNSKKELCVTSRIETTRPHEVSMRESTNHITKYIEKIKEDIVLEDPAPLIQKTDIKKTLPRSKDQKGTLDAKRRWKLTDEQWEHVEYLKKEGVDSDDKTLCYWAKTYSFERLYDVLQAAKSKPRKSLGAFMNKLLKDEAILENSTVKSNAEFAKDYADSHGWNQLKIGKKYVTIDFGRDTLEISLNLPCSDFIRMLMEKHESFFRRD